MMKLKPTLALLLGAFTTIALTSTTNAQSHLNAVAPAIVDGADLQIFLDLEKMNDSSFFKAIEEKFGGLADDSDEIGDIKDALKAAGMETDDIKALALSFPNVMAMAEGGNSVRMIASAFLGGKIDHGAFQSFISGEMSEAGSVESKGSVSGFETFQMLFNDPTAPSLLMGSRETSGGSILMVGTESDFQGVAGASGVPTAVAGLNALSSKVLESNQGWISFTLPADLQAMLGQEVAAGAGGMPGADALQGLEQILITMSADEALSLNIGLRLSNAQQAEEITNLLRFSLIGMVRMMVAQQFQGQPPAFFQSLQAAQDGDVAILKTKLTLQDIEAFQALAGDLPMMIPGL